MTDADSPSVCRDCGASRAPGPCPRCLPGPLESGTLLQGRYLVAALRRRDPLGFSHFGVDQQTESLVSIREYAPLGLATREEEGRLVVAPEDQARWGRGLRGFLLRCDRMAALQGEGLVGLRAKPMFNGTSYAILEYEAGARLGELLQQGERFRDGALESIVQDILRSLVPFHRRGVAYMGVNPWTVALTKGGQARLVDVGWFEPELSQGMTESERLCLPPEALDQPLAWQPAGDLYSLGALAVALEHGEPLEAARMEAARNGDGPPWLQRLLQPKPGDRPHDADELLESWEAPSPDPPSPGLVDVVRTRLQVAQDQPPPPAARRALLVGSGALLAGAAAGLTFLLAPRDPLAGLLGPWRGAPGGVTVFPEYAGEAKWPAARAVAIRSRGARLRLTTDRLRFEALDQGLMVDQTIRIVPMAEGEFELRVSPETRYKVELREGLLRLMPPDGMDRVFRPAPSG
ncbi:MAG: hypothetical protein AAGD10_12820 [Myxococcota bacterium]